MNNKNNNIQQYQQEEEEEQQKHINLHKFLNVQELISRVSIVFCRM